MFNLTDPNIGYLIISSQTNQTNISEVKFLSDKLSNILYAKDYTLIPLTGYYDQQYEKAFIAITGDNNDQLRHDAIYLMDEFNQNSVIVKYINETDAKKILTDGSEITMGLSVYDSELKHKTYIYNGISFSFVEQKRYFFPTKKEEIKPGMIVEFFNNNKWTPKQVTNVDIEYEKMYKLLMKYEKLRICQV